MKSNKVSHVAKYFMIWKKKNSTAMYGTGMSALVTDKLFKCLLFICQTLYSFVGLVCVSFKYAGLSRTRRKANKW